MAFLISFLTKAIMRAIPTLQRQMATLPNPSDYFHGVGSDDIRMPFNILLFSRRSTRDLYTREGAPSLHRRHVLIFNLDGAGALILDGHWLAFRPGQCALILPHQIHAFAEIQSTKISWLFITFDRAGSETLEPLRNRTLGIPPPCVGWLGQLTSCWKNHAARIPFLTGIILSELLESAGQPARSEPRQNNGMEETITRLHQILHIEPGQRIKELARRLGFSEAHLRAEFRRSTQLSLGHYLRQFRINRATLLLTSTMDSIGEIATQCGFQSLYSFSRSFRAAKGMPPRTFRRRFYGDG